MNEQPKIDTSGALAYYPTHQQVDAWAEALLHKSEQIAVTGELLAESPIRIEFGNGPNAIQNRFVRFTGSDGRQFWGYWQPAFRRPAPLLINLPGYGGRISLHPQISDAGYNVLHVSPLGYVSPKGADVAKQGPGGNWPVLANTAMGEAGGYEDWLLDCLLAIRWGLEQPGVMADRLSFFGTSQGGGGSLLLASVLGSRVRCVCADLPFLTNFPLSGLEGDAYGMLRPAHEALPAQLFWNRMGYFDTLSHAHRLQAPVMLSCGGKDVVCMPETIRSLFEALTCTKQLTYLKEGVHNHLRESMFLFRGWLELWA